MYREHVFNCQELLDSNIIALMRLLRVLDMGGADNYTGPARGTQNKVFFVFSWLQNLARVKRP